MIKLFPYSLSFLQQQKWIDFLCNPFKFCFLFFSILLATNAMAQSSPADCKTGCTSNDVQIQAAYLSDINGNQLPETFVCPSSGTATVYLTLELTTKTPRVGVVIYTNIKNFTPPSTIGSLVATITQCFGITLNQPTNKVTFTQPFNWTCGSPIVLTDVFIGWGTGNTNFCTGSGFQCPATSSKCYSLPPGQYIPIQTPTANPASATLCSTAPGGTTAVFDLTALNSTVSGTQTNVTVTWWTDVNLTNQITTPATYTSATGMVYAKVTSNVSPYPFSKSTVTLTVVPSSVGGTVAAAQTICSGSQPASLTLSGNTGNVVRWEKSADAAFTTPITITNTSTTLTGATIGNLSADTWFRAVVQNGTCTAANSGAVKISVDPTSVGGTVAAAQTICSGSQPASLTLSGNTGNVVRWEKSADAAFTTPTSIANTATTLTGATIGNLSADTWFRAVVQSGVCAAANSGAVKITINATSVGGSVGSAQTICSGSQPASLTLSGNTGNVVRWEKSSDAAFTSPISITNTSTTLTGATIGSLSADTWFRAVVQSGVCPATNSGAVKISVDPTSVGGTVAAAQSICSGTQPANLSLSGNTGTVVRWEKSSDAAFTSPISIANTTTTLTGAAIGNLSADTWFRAVVQSGVCAAANSGAVKITVNSLPLPPSVTYNAPACDETTFSLTVGSSSNPILLGAKYIVLSKTGQPITGITPASPYTANATDVANNQIIFSNIPAGSGFIVTIESASGCTPANIPLACGGSSGRPGGNTTVTKTEPVTQSDLVSEASVKAYPNPFSDKVRFLVSSPVPGQGTLDLYNLVGQKVKTVYRGMIAAGVQTFEVTMPGQAMSTLVYVLSIGDKKLTGKLVQINQ